jgi:hypothetical protein
MKKPSSLETLPLKTPIRRNTVGCHWSVQKATLKRMQSYLARNHRHNESEFVNESIAARVDGYERAEKAHNKEAQ